MYKKNYTMAKIGVNSMEIKSTIEVIFDGGASLNAKQVSLLKAVKATGSITSAAKKLDISYKNAWDSLNAVNLGKNNQVLMRQNGNKKNSGSVLSEYCEKLIAQYDLIYNANTAFLYKLKNIPPEDMDLKTLTLRLSAKNQLPAKIEKIITGAVDSEIFGRLASGDILKSTITFASLKRLNLRENDEITFIFKAPKVTICDQKSSDNSIKTEICDIKIGEKHSKIVCSLGKDKITAMISNDQTIKMKLKVGDKVFICVESSDIIIGV